MFGRLLAGRSYHYKMLIASVLLLSILSFGSFFTYVRHYQAIVCDEGKYDDFTKRCVVKATDDSEPLPVVKEVVILRGHKKAGLNEDDTFDKGPINRFFASDAQWYLDLHLRESNLNAKSCPGNSAIVIIVHSHIKHFVRRDAIRKSWGNTSAVRFPVGKMSTYNWRVLFIVGRAVNATEDRLIQKEAKRHGDMILLDIYEERETTTLKTLIAMYWYLVYCPTAKFYLKCHDDVFINPYSLIRYVIYLTTGRMTRGVYAGQVSSSGLTPRKDIGETLAILYKEYSDVYIPDYCLGFAYLMSKDVVAILLQTVEHVQMITTADDIYIGILAFKSNIRPRHYPHLIHSFNLERKVVYKISIRALNERIVEHGIVNYRVQMMLLNAVKGKLGRRWKVPPAAKKT